MKLHFARLNLFRLQTKILLLLGMSLMPFAWYCLLVNHSVIHPHFTYKILIITIYAILTAFICIIKEKKPTGN